MSGEPTNNHSPERPILAAAWTEPIQHDTGVSLREQFEQDTLDMIAWEFGRLVGPARLPGDHTGAA